MDFVRRSNWRNSLKVKMYDFSGIPFQDFFGSVMEAVHGSDYIRIRPFGKLGDKGCDGYLDSTGEVFQCYAPLPSDDPAVATLVKKIGDDFALAINNISSVMRAWTFAHNFVRGLPVQAVQKKDKLQSEYSSIPLAFLGPSAFEDLIFGLPDEKIEDLLGPAASDSDYNTADANLIAGMLLAVAGNNRQVSDAEIKPVPIDKIEINGLSSKTALLIRQGLINEPLVSDFLQSLPNPTLGDTLAKILKTKYEALRGDGLDPDTLYALLFDFILGERRVKAPSTGEQVAAQAILSYFFYSCDVFEDQPARSASGDASTN